MARCVKKIEAAAALKLTAPDLLKAGIIDEIVSEPVGGRTGSPARWLLDETLGRVLTEITARLRGCAGDMTSSVDGTARGGVRG